MRKNTIFRWNKSVVEGARFLALQNSWPLLGFVFLAFATFYTFKDISSYSRIDVWDESMVLYRSGFNQPFALDWSPIYLIWYKFLRLFSSVPLQIYFINSYIISVSMVLAVFFLLIRNGTHWLIGFFAATFILYWDLNAGTLNKVNNFNALLLIAALCFLSRKEIRKACLALSLFSLALTYLRPENLLLSIEFLTAYFYLSKKAKAITPRFVAAWTILLLVVLKYPSTKNYSTWSGFVSTVSGYLNRDAAEYLSSISARLSAWPHFLKDLPDWSPLRTAFEFHLGIPMPNLLIFFLVVLFLISHVTVKNRKVHFKKIHNPWPEIPLLLRFYFVFSFIKSVVVLGLFGYFDRWFVDFYLVSFCILVCMVSQNIKFKVFQSKWAAAAVIFVTLFIIKLQSTPMGSFKVPDPPTVAALENLQRLKKIECRHSDVFFSHFFYPAFLDSNPPTALNPFDYFKNGEETLPEYIRKSGAHIVIIDEAFRTVAASFGYSREKLDQDIKAISKIGFVQPEIFKDDPSVYIGIRR